MSLAQLRRGARSSSRRSNATVPVTTNLVARLIAGKGVTADGSGLVSAWADQSGTGSDAAQATAINQPLSTFDRWGRPVVQFQVDPTAANSDWMTFANAVDFNAQAVSIFVCARILYPGESSVVGLQNYAGAASHLRFTNAGNTSLPETLRTGSRDSLVTGPLEPIVLSVVSGTGTNVELSLGPDLVSGLTANTADADCLGAWLGTFGPGAYQSMDVYEVLVYNRAVTSGESAQIRSYLSSKYGTRTTAWPNNMVCEGDSITQGVGTTNKRGYPAALWRQSTGDWHVTDIGTSGATISTLTTRAAGTDAAKRTGARNVLMVLIGRNDVAANTGTVVYSNLVTYVQARVTAGWEVWVATCIATSATFQSIIDDLNARIRGTTGPGIISDAGAAKVIDFASVPAFATAAASGNTTYYQSDQTHPTAVGATLMADFVASEMYSPRDTTAADGNSLTLNNVGPRNIPLTTYTGPATITLDDGTWLGTYNNYSRVVRGMRFDGCSFTLNANVSPILFVDCQFTGTPPAASIIAGSGTGITLMHCDFDVRGQTPRLSRYQGCYLQHATVQNCRFRGFDTAIEVGQSSTYDRCWISDVMPYDVVIDQHQAAISAQHAWPISGSTVSRCKMLAGHWQNPTDARGISAAISHYNDGVHTGLTFDSNYIAAAAAYGMYCGALSSKPDAYSTNLHITNNVFGRDYERYCGSAFPAYGFNSADGTNSWTGNTYGPTGPFNIGGDAVAGTTITQPGVDSASSR